MPIDTVLFDLDGTIADSLPLIKHTYATVFQEMGIPWGNDDVMKLIGLPLREIGRIMAGAGKVEEFFQKYQMHYRKFHDTYIKIFPGTEEMFAQLRKKGFTLGVVTSKAQMGTEMTLSLLKLKPYFTVVVTVDDTVKHKPDPEPLLFALSRLGKTPDRAYFVGDSPFDIVAGNGAGVTTIAVTWGMATETELKAHQPKFIAHTREELIQIIENR